MGGGGKGRGLSTRSWGSGRVWNVCKERGYLRAVGGREAGGQGRPKPFALRAALSSPLATALPLPPWPPSPGLRGSPSAPQEASPAWCCPGDSVEGSHRAGRVRKTEGPAGITPHSGRPRRPMVLSPWRKPLKARGIAFLGPPLRYPQTWQLETTEMYSLTAGGWTSEPRCPQSRASPKAWQDPPGLFLASAGPTPSRVVRGLGLPRPHLCPMATPLLLCVSVCPLLFLKGHWSVAHRPALNPR